MESGTVTTWLPVIVPVNFITACLATDVDSVVSPTPGSTFAYKIHYNAAPALLENNDTNYISMNFPNGLLYCCLAETYGFLKGPSDMLQLYEQKYQREVQRFGGEQIGRRRRDDYTDGTGRIPVNSPTP